MQLPLPLPLPIQLPLPLPLLVPLPIPGHQGQVGLSLVRLLRPHVVRHVRQHLHLAPPQLDDVEELLRPDVEILETPIAG